MSIRVPKNDPSTLSNELVAARSQYEATKQSVIDRAQDRHTVVQATIGDLENEQQALESIVAQAKQ